MRTYEMVFITDPRVSDDEVGSLTEDVKKMLTAAGGEVIREEQWGRRKLAYEIDKMKEGKYTLLYLQGEDGQLPLSEVEHRMRQNDKVLRYLTVRTDEGLKRAGLPLPVAMTAEELAAAQAAAAGEAPEPVKEAE